MALEVGTKVRLLSQLPGELTDYRATGKVAELVDVDEDGETDQYLVKMDDEHNDGGPYQFVAEAFVVL